MSFTLIQVGDKVYDKKMHVMGKVSYVNYEKNTSIVEVDENNSYFSEISNLIKANSKNNKTDSDGLNKGYMQVKEFHTAFNHPVSESPVEMELSRAVSRAVWTGEEALVEFIHASSKNEDEFIEAFDKMLVGLQKAKEKSLKMEYYNDGTERIVAQSDALVDALYFIFGSFVEMGVKPDKLFDIVQNSNMSKLFTDENGKKYAQYREGDGKILKSPEFFPPEDKLKEEIENQINSK